MDSPVEKKRNSRISNQKKIFGAHTLPISEADQSRLIGSIVEKGISDDKPLGKRFTPIPPPKPSVLPFPVARHRSHGPHWGPIESAKNGDDYNEDDEDEDEDEEEFLKGHPFASFANPVQRKQKKSLDFRKWKDLMPSDDFTLTRKAEKNRSVIVKTEKQRENGEVTRIAGSNVSSDPPVGHLEVPMELDVQQHANSRVVLSRTEDTTRAGFPTSAADMKLDNSDQLPVLGNASSCNFKGEVGLASTGSPMNVEGMSFNNLATAHFERMDSVGSTVPEVPTKAPSSTRIFSSKSKNSTNEQGSFSLESEIDAENRAQLERMSPEEIAEAQAEIMEKMDPALLNLLKKRGLDKLKKQNFSSSVIAANDKMDNAKSGNQLSSASISSGSQSDNLQMMTSDTSKDTKDRLKNSVLQNSGSTSSSLWEAWSQRVEAIKELRFSLDGTVVDNEFVPKPETGELLHRRLSTDTAAERDFLRTEGDPGAAGYTIKEAVALTRSAVPGQRALALHLLESVVDKAIHNICQNQVGSTTRNGNKVDKSTDWEAVWAFALGPEPELILALRMCLDDNHNSVVLACAKVIQCILSCDLNESFCDILETTAIHGNGYFMAPVFRSKPEIDVGFLRGGFWKYNAKPSNIFPFSEDTVDDETEGSHTIQDDIILAGQDFAAGLVRMGVLPRIRYLLETETTAALDECIISILVAIARHSPTCVNAIVRCQRLVQAVVCRFNMNNDVEVRPSQIKSVCLLKVLALCDKKFCMEIVKNGIFQVVTWHLYQYTSSLDQWIKLGRENCKLSSALMVEQLRFWKGCIRNGRHVLHFSDIFQVLCLWLNPPAFEKLMESNVLCEFVSVSTEAFLVLEALAGTLPNFYSQKHPSYQIEQCTGNNMEAWSWSYVGPMVDLALKWVSLMHELFDWKKGIKSDSVFQGISVTPLLWLYSAVMHMLSRVLERVTPDDTVSLDGSGHLPWLPEFVPKIGLEIVRNGLLSFSVENVNEYGTNFAVLSSFVEVLCCLRQKSENESSLASVCCLHGLVQVVVSVDNLIHLSKAGIQGPPSKGCSSLAEEYVLETGILKGSLVELRCLLNVFMKLVQSGWQFVQSIERSGRGGPAPGVGLGWGSSDGGFWSITVLLAQTDARLLIHLLKIFQMVSVPELPKHEQMAFMMQRINTALAVCLTAGPRDRSVVEKASEFLFEVPALEYLDLCTRRFLQFNRRMKSFGWEHREEDYLHFSEVLNSHFRNRWLCIKRKSEAMDGNSCSHDRTSKRHGVSLDTIHEDIESPNMTSQDRCSSSLLTEWAHQRLPLPGHCFLSPIATICDSKSYGLKGPSNIQNLLQDPPEVLEAAKAGLFFLLGIEAMSTFLPIDAPSHLWSVPLIWKLHSLSVILLVGIGVLEEEKSRDVYESLQDLYGQILDEARSTRGSEHDLERLVNPSSEIRKNYNVESLRFQSEIDERYSLFVEALVEQYAAVSYGDLVYGRQLAVYLHRCVEASVRLATWNALSNAHVLELLPPLEKCFMPADGYLEPVEDNDNILEAYVNSWVSGALDRAATRGSLAYTLVLHHLSSFIFLKETSDKLTLRNKLAKSLLRDYSRKQNHKGMILDFVRYNKVSMLPMSEEKEGSLPERTDIGNRLEVLKEACEGNSALLTEVEKLRCFFVKVCDPTESSMA